MNATDSSGRRDKRVHEREVQPVRQSGFGRALCPPRNAPKCAHIRATSVIGADNGSARIVRSRTCPTSSHFGVLSEFDAILPQAQRCNRTPRVALVTPTRKRWPSSLCQTLPDCGQRLPPAAGSDALAPAQNHQASSSLAKSVCPSAVRAFLFFRQRLIAPSHA